MVRLSESTSLSAESVKAPVAVQAVQVALSCTADALWHHQYFVLALVDILAGYHDGVSTGMIIRLLVGCCPRCCCSQKTLLGIAWLSILHLLESSQTSCVQDSQ